MEVIKINNNLFGHLNNNLKRHIQYLLIHISYTDYIITSLKYTIRDSVICTLLKKGDFSDKYLSSNKEK